MPRLEYKPPIDPSRIRPHYSKFLGGEKRILLTGHSHRCWPDVTEEGQMRPVRLAQEHKDLKWKPIFGEIIPEFQRLVASRIGVRNPDLIAFGENTHSLVTEVLSCFPWDERTKIVTTSSEFLSLRRQLLRLKEDGVRIDFVSTEDKTSLTDRLVNAITDDTNIVAISTVLFDQGYVLQDVSRIIEKARKVGALVILDVYHQFNIRELDVDAWGDDIFVTTGFYKYGQSGEGLAILKVPSDCSKLRPRITVWYQHFDALEREPYPDPIEYGDAHRRWSNTIEASVMCRAIETMKFMDAQGLTVRFLQANNLYQIAYMIQLFDRLGLSNLGAGLLSSREYNERGPFLALGLNDAKRAKEVVRRLNDEKDVLIDHRGHILRLGPAEYTTQEEIVSGMERLAEVLRAAF